MGEAFDKWLSKAYPGYVRTQATVYEIEAWNAALRYAASVADTVRTDRGPNMSPDTACDIIKEIVLREEVQGEA